MDPRLIVPPLPTRTVARPRPLELLDRATASPLTVVSAGPGAGKSVLLSDWYSRHEGDAAWMGLSPADDDPQRFWPAFLRLARLSGEPALMAMWRDGGGEPVEAELDPDPSRTPVVVVLDDAHVLTHPQILAGLDQVVRMWSDRVRLVLAARRDPMLPLHRYRLAGQMSELRGADLAMTEDEARELLRAHGVELSQEDLRLLVARTEGWTAGIRLAAMRMEGMSAPAQFVAQFAVDRGSIGEYLMEEVLAQQPSEVRRLLVETSFLDVVSGPLADAVTGTTGSADVLRSLARTNSFVIPLDLTETSFRLHQMFRDVLSYLAEREAPERLPARQRRAAEFFRREGDLLGALHWAVRGDDPGMAATLVVRGGFLAAYVGRQDLRRLGWDRAALVAAGAGMPAAEARAVGLSVAAATDESPDRAAAALDELAAPAGPGDGADVEPVVRLTAAVAELVLARSAGRWPLLDTGVDRVLADTELAGVLAGVPGLRAGLLLLQSRARFAAGRPEEVEPLLARALEDPELSGAPAVELEILSVLAVAGASGARPRHSDDALARASALLAAHPDLIEPVELDVAIARYAHLQADLETMGTALSRAVASGALGAGSVVAANLTFVQGTYLHAVGQLALAYDLLQDDPVLGSPRAGLLGVYRDAELAAIETVLGRPHAALNRLAAHRGTPFAVAVAVPAARAHLALGDLRAARDEVRQVVTTPSPFVNRAVLVDALLCDAQISLAAADDGRAVELVDRATQIAAGDVVLPFLRVADVLAPLLARHPTLAASWPSRLRVPEARPETVVFTPSDRLFQALTERERAVLRYMATSMSTAEIAADLCLSVNTVKTHVASIYRKLSARGRREAVYRARELELL